MNKSLIALSIGVVVSLGFSVYAALASPDLDLEETIDRVMETISGRLGGATAFGEIVTGPDPDKQLRRSDLKLTLGSSILNGTGKHSTSTASVTYKNPLNADIFITDIGVIVTGTSSGTFILDGATTSPRSTKLDTTNTDLIDFRVTSVRPTTTPLSLINSWRIATTTFPQKGVYFANVQLAELSNDASSTASLSPSRKVLGVATFGSGEGRYTDATEVFKPADTRSWPGVRVRPNESISFVLSQDNYNVGCVQQANADHAAGVACWTATSTYVGFRVDLLISWVSTSTRNE